MIDKAIKRIRVQKSWEDHAGSCIFCDSILFRCSLFKALFFFHVILRHGFLLSVLIVFYTTADFAYLDFKVSIKYVNKINYY